MLGYLFVSGIWQIKDAIQPLYDLLTRFAPDPSYLTPIHPIFITVNTVYLFGASTSLNEFP
jgi:hypothetical protein